jgi:endonuclease YncB( thermonuclease family)
MSFRFRKSKKFGPLLVTMTHRGPTLSVGGGGFRYQLAGNRSRRKREAIDDGTASGSIFRSLLKLSVLAVGGLFIIGYLFSGSDEATIPPAETQAASIVPETNDQQFEAATIAELVPEHSTEDAAVDIPILPGDYRTWFDASGRHSVNARLLGVLDDTAYLQKESGIGPVRIVKLHELDQKYIDTYRAKNTIRGTVVGISNGDTISIRGDETYKIRLLGIDAPEDGQDFAKESRIELSDKAFRKNATVEWNRKDDTGQILGHVLIDGRWINNELVAQGCAWHHEDSSVILASAEDEARTAKLGLWASDNPTPPWKYEPPKPKPKPVIVKSEPTIDSFKRTTPSYTPSYSGGGAVQVRGYYRKDGTYVRPHTRRSPRR